MKNQTEQNLTGKNISKRKYILGAVIIFLSITAALVYIYFTQEQKPDPASEAVIRAEAAAQLNKDPNELTDDDFAQFTEFSFDMSRTIRLPRKIVGSGRNAKVIVRELSDISLFEKFTNLQRLTLVNIGYPDKNIPKWMKIMAKFGFIDLADRFSIDLSPLEKLNTLQYLTFSMMPLKNVKPLSSLTNLEGLTLEYTEVCDLEPLKDLTKLRVLVIGHSQISNLEPIKGLKNLQKLIMPSSQVSELEPLRGLKKLEDLNISYTKVSDLRPLMGLKNLKKLYIEDCNSIPEYQVEDLQKALPDLRIER